MNELKLDEDIHAFGFPLPTFPEGINDAFAKLIEVVPGGFTRSFFGICQMTNQGMTYFVAAEEKEDGEAEQLKLDRVVVEKATYLVRRIEGWRTKTYTINDAFHELLQDPKANHKKPSVEWYKNEHEMLCMIQSTAS